MKLSIFLKVENFNNKTKVSAYYQPRSVAAYHLGLWRFAEQISSATEKSEDPGSNPGGAINLFQFFIIKCL